MNERETSTAVAGIIASGVTLALLILLLLGGFGPLGAILLALLIGLIIMGLLLWFALGGDGMPSQLRDRITRAGSSWAPMRDRMSQSADRIGRSVSPLREKIGRSVSPLRERIGSAVPPLRERIDPLRQRIGQSVSPWRERISAALGAGSARDPQQRDRQQDETLPQPAPEAVSPVMPAGDPDADMAARPVADAPVAPPVDIGVTEVPAEQPAEPDRHEVLEGDGMPHGSATELPTAGDDFDHPPVIPLDDAQPAPAAARFAQKPAPLEAPREGRADDLTRIRGIGPKLEAMLHDMGVWHYDQIAGWSREEVAWVDDNIEGFKGRVTRDDWVAQATALASGREAPLSRRPEDGDLA